MTLRQPFAARDYYSDPRRRAKTAAIRLASRGLRPLGIDVEHRHWYSPIPQAETIPEAFWDTPSELPGIDGFETAAHLDWVERELAPFIAEFTPPRGPEGLPAGTYFLDNGLYQGVDADVLYAVIRRFRPHRVLELGAGFSTLVSAAAVERNGEDGHETTLIACDPYALPPEPGAVPGLAELRAVKAEAVPLEEYAALGDGDILFIDSSHTVKVGGDVTHLFGEVLPRLAPGVLVHLHDIYLPWPYPRAWIERMRWYWAEQYMLQAFLTSNPRVEVLFAAYAAHRRDPARLGRLVPNYRQQAAPLSVWLRIREP